MLPPFMLREHGHSTAQHGSNNAQSRTSHSNIMSAGDIKTIPKTPKELNAYLADRSYVHGYAPSKYDVEAFNAIGKPPAAGTVNLLRWYNHIKSFSADERKKWGGAPAAACPMQTAKTTTAPPPPADDDDVDLFASDEEEDADAARVREERLAAYAAKKEKKPALIAKSSILLDVKPWDDETDMKLMEASVRTIQMDGLLWGASKLVPVGYGIHKLQIMCVIEDDKVSVDLLTEEIEKFEDFVQSVDVAAFNKI